MSKFDQALFNKIQKALEGYTQFEISRTANQIRITDNQVVDKHNMYFYFLIDIEDFNYRNLSIEYSNEKNNMSNYITKYMSVWDDHLLLFKLLDPILDRKTKIKNLLKEL